VQLSISPGEIVFANADCGNNQRESSGADVQRVAIKRRKPASAIQTYSRIRQAQREAQARSHTSGTSPISNKTAQT
jgi:hypothetical protein